MSIALYTGLVLKVTAEPISEAMGKYINAITNIPHANHVFYDKVLERSYNDHSYWADGAYHYNICDYLGNVRTVVKSDGTLCERNDYYPFGMLHDPTAANADVQPRKYGGKELDRQNGLDLYDSQARWYDPILARTTTMDAKAESYYDISPYVWCGANPVRNIDPTGEDHFIYGTNGEYIKRVKADDDQIRLVKEIKDSKPQIVASVKLPEGSIEESYVADFENSKKEQLKATVIHIRGDEKAYEVYKMFADNTGLEWSLHSLGEEGEKGLNIISTSRTHSKESSTVWLFKKQIRHGYTYRQYIHNHPKGSDVNKKDKSHAEATRKITNQDVKFYLYRTNQSLYEYTPVKQ